MDPNNILNPYKVLPIIKDQEINEIKPDLE